MMICKENMSKICVYTIVHSPTTEQLIAVYTMMLGNRNLLPECFASIPVPISELYKDWNDTSISPAV